MDICLPGMASKVKRAPTSATRSAPLAITINWTKVMTPNITTPISKSPCTTNLPKAATRWPASALAKMPRVEERLRAKRNRVLTKRKLGKEERSSTFLTNMALTKRVTDNIRLIGIKRSNNQPGTGTTNMAVKIRTATAAARSGWRKRRPKPKAARAFIVELRCRVEWCGGGAPGS
jgi:hypothetical protein